jgi:Coenzyme PQQ synthesis protein D (PqqD)
MKSEVFKSTRIKAIQEQVSSNLGEESIVLNLKFGVYYGLNSVGTRIWDLIQSPKTIAEIQETIVAEYDVEPEQCGNDITEIFKGLKTAGLIEVQDGEAA